MHSPVSIESLDIDKLPHRAMARSITEENMSADSLNAPEAAKRMQNHDQTDKEYKCGVMRWW